MPRALALLLILLAAPLAALDRINQFDQESPDDADAKAEQKVMEKSATYRIARATFTASPAYDTAAAEHVRQARAIMLDKSAQPLESAFTWRWMWSPWTRARWVAENGLDGYPYSASAGDLMRVALDCEGHDRSVAGVRDWLIKLWYSLPDYPDLAGAMETACAVAESAQDFQTHVDLTADDPARMVAIEGRGYVEDTDRLFHFLSDHGDRESVAPRAALGLARARLLSGRREDVHAARFAYERLLESYPDHPIAFQALLELALSHLATYRGDEFDVGALQSAERIIDQADLEAGADKGRQASVLAYRKRIRSWTQDRDLHAARWYRARGHVAWLREFTMPPGLQDWRAGSLYYYREVIRRDPGSPQAQVAERELAALGGSRESGRLGVPEALPVAPR